VALFGTLVIFMAPGRSAISSARSIFLAGGAQAAAPSLSTPLVGGGAICSCASLLISHRLEKPGGHRASPSA
jgi:hypothetical protein